MTNKQINIAIAEACGWKEESFGPSWYESVTKIPDYCNDLNAMHEAEKVLTPTEFEAYRWILWGLCKRPQVTEWNRAYLSATAAQRVEALLRAIGKWEEA